METVFGILSAIIVFLSYPVYVYRIWQRKIIPNIASWSIFVIISVAIFLSYASSGAKENALTTYGPMIGCGIIFLVSLLRSKEKTINKLDILCIFFGCTSILTWYFTKDAKQTAQFALYLALLADFIGIIPSIIFLNKHPEKDRPAMWIIFSLGYFLTIFAIKDHTVSNWVLPIFMVIIPSFCWIPLIRYRIKNKIPIKEWV